MKIVSILNGNPDNSNVQFDLHLEKIKKHLESNDHRVEIFYLRDLKIISCTGCWGCWVKTPGECLFEDDSKMVREKVIHSDWLIFASPLIMGFTSALLKMFQDKLIPLLHPYIELIDNECHHMKRYDQYPLLGLLYGKEPDTDKQDIEIVTDIYKRFALNFRSELKFSKSIEEPFELLTNEIIHH
jgi:hypothetical protein